MNQTLLWKENLTDGEWDTVLTELGGHPLQSAVWGNVRKTSDHIKDHRWVAFQHGKPVFLARFEERCILKKFKIAWAPKGPVAFDPAQEIFLKKIFFKRLREKKFFIFADNQWLKVDASEIKRTSHRTIWIDLKLGKETLWAKLSKQFRYDVRHAKKLGVTVERSTNLQDVHEFYQMCQSVSQHKNFNLNVSEQVMKELLQQQTNSVESQLFIARFENKLCGGAMVIRCGQNAHYLWGGIDRQFSKLTVGEVLQWEIIEWAIEQGCNIYDLEGINLKKNPGTYQFKKKLGGDIIPLPGVHFYFLNRFIQLITAAFGINYLISLSYA
jgi:hypothetical protein